METISEPITKQVLSDLKLCLKSFKPDNSVVCFQNHLCEDVPKKFVRPKSDRFLINMYERPPCIEKARRSFNGSITKLEKNKLSFVCDNSDKKDCFRKNDSFDKQKTMDQYVLLRSRRDVECLKLKQASNILQYLNKYCRHGSWEERLLAEKFILESSLAIDLLKNKIRKDYISITQKEVQIGTISLSSFKFHVNKQHLKHNETEFFVLMLSNETEVCGSKIARASNGDVVFDEEFTFSITRNFKIKLQLHSIVMKEASKLCSISTLLRIKNCQRRNFSKLQYKNLNTCDFEETKVLKTSFKHCAGTEIGASNIHNKAWELSLTEGSGLNEFVDFSARVKNFKIDYRRCGFLTMGCNFKEVVVWDRRWCILDGSLLKIYNSPSEEDVFEAQFVLNLGDCPLREVEEASRIECCRRRSMVLIMRRGDEVDKYYFMADGVDDLKSWLGAFNLILDLLRFKNSYKL